MGVHSCIEGALNVVFECVRRHGDDGDGLRVRAVECADGLCGGQAVHDGHAHIHQHCIVAAGGAFREGADGGLAIDDVVDGDPLRLEHVHHDFCVDGYVFGQQHVQPFERGRLSICGWAGCVARGGDSRYFGEGRALLEHDADGERRADAFLAFDLDGAVHHGDDLLCDGHAQAAAAVSVRRSCIFLGERAEQLGQEVLVHADSRVLDDELDGAIVGFAVFEPGREADASGHIGELDGIAQDVDEDLLELRVVADEQAGDIAAYLVLVVEALLAALVVDDDVDLRKEVVEGKLLFPEGHLARLDSIHVQDVVDEAEQVARADADYLEPLARGRGQLVVFEGDGVEADDGVHGRADFMAHGGKEGRLGAAALLCCFKLRFEALVFLDSVGDALEEHDHHEHENASSKEDSRDDQIGFAEERDGQVADEEQREQDDRNGDGLALGVPAALFADVAGELDVPVDVVRHEGAAKVDHTVQQCLHGPLLH